jgi:hypothetical protein
LKTALANHDCKTVPEAGLAGRKNGVLLSLAESAGFDVFLTMDKGLQYQQNLTGRGIAIVVLAKSYGLVGRDTRVTYRRVLPPPPGMTSGLALAGIGLGGRDTLPVLASAISIRLLVSTLPTD